MDIEVAKLSSQSDAESEVSQSMRFSTKPNNASTFYNTKYDKGKKSDDESPPTIELN